MSRLSEGLQRALRESANYGRTCLLTEMDARTILQTVAALEADLACAQKSIAARDATLELTCEERGCAPTWLTIGQKLEADLAACRGRVTLLDDALDAALKDRDYYSDKLDAAEGRVAALREGQIVHIVFDGPPSHESGRFVEVEDPEGHGLSVGEWIERPDGYWALVVRLAALDTDVEQTITMALANGMAAWQEAHAELEAKVAALETLIRNARVHGAGNRLSDGSETQVITLCVEDVNAILDAPPEPPEEEWVIMRRFKEKPYGVLRTRIDATTILTDADVERVT